MSSSQESNDNRFSYIKKLEVATVDVLYSFSIFLAPFLLIIFTVGLNYSFTWSGDVSFEFDAGASRGKTCRKDKNHFSYIGESPIKAFSAILSFSSSFFFFFIFCLREGRLLWLLYARIHFRSFIRRGNSKCDLQKNT